MGRPIQYPWDSWIDGRSHQLIQGVNFQSSIPSFQALVHRTAKVRGLTVKTSVKGRVVVIRFDV